MDWNGNLAELAVISPGHEQYVETLAQYIPFVFKLRLNLSGSGRISPLACNPKHMQNLARLRFSGQLRNGNKLRFPVSMHLGTVEGYGSRMGVSFRGLPPLSPAL